MADATTVGYGFRTGPFPQNADSIVEGYDVQLTDSDYVRFGSLDGGDANLGWDGTNLTLKPAVDDTGSFIINDGTTDFDVKVFLGDTLNYVLCDVGNKWFHVQHSTAGGDSAKGMLVDVDVLAGNGFRQGGIQVTIARASGQDFTWDGNPDCGIKVIATNLAANASNEGAARGIDVQARNRGTNASWMSAANFNARNDSGKTCTSLYGIDVRIESYGTITDAYGLNVNMSIEGASTTKTGIIVRNTDQSGMTAVTQAFTISHTSTNGFTYLINFAGATGDTASTGSLTDSGSADVACDAKIAVVFNGTPYWIPLFNTAA